MSLLGHSFRTVVTGPLLAILAGPTFAQHEAATKQPPEPAAASANAMDNWPQWRGPLTTGVAPHADPSIHWSGHANVRWKVELPGKGHSTPAIWNDRIFLTAAVPYGEALPLRHSGAPGGHDELPITHRIRFVVLAVNRDDGTIRRVPCGGLFLEL